MFKLSIIFLCLAITKCMGYQCTKDGEFKDPDNPHKFYHCTNGEAFPFVCQEDLVFDENVKKCVYVSGVSTAAPETRPTTAAPVNTSPATQPTTAAHINTTPEIKLTTGHVVGPTDKPLMDCKGKKGFFKDPTNPHQFIECVNDLPALFKCPENLVFNEAKGACDFDGTASSSSSSSSVSASTAKPALNFQCPQKNGFFKEPQNAHKFIECVDGRALEFTCPENLVFNEAKGQCDFDGTASSPSSSSSSSVSASTAKPALNFQCPEKNGFFKEPQNAHKFIECVDGRALEFVCPENLVFNENLKRCDFDASASGTPTAHTDVGTQSHATLPSGPTGAPETGSTRIRHTQSPVY